MISLSILIFGSIFAENKLESASYSITYLNNIVNGETNNYQKVSFVLNNITQNDIMTIMKLEKVYMADEHNIEYCFGDECSFFTSDMDKKETSPFTLKAGTTTNPEIDSYLKMLPNGNEGSDTIIVTIYNINNAENDFVRFTAIWNFKDGSIKILDGKNIYPIPAVNYVNISNLNNADIIEIYDISGNLVYTQNVTSDKLTINISTLLKGTYFGYLIRNNNKINSFRLVK